MEKPMPKMPEKKPWRIAPDSGLITLADDSGSGSGSIWTENPGCIPPDFSGKPGATDADRRDYLLEKLKDHPRPWPAVFRSTVVIAMPDGSTYTLDGECRGEIIPEERGSNGFGYDPIFLD